MPAILLTNDDGVDSPGLSALESALEPLGDITIVAPDRERSATSHSLTLNEPLRYHQVASNRYAVQGTPADCIILAALRIMKERPAIVVSGVNRGSNVGDDVNYSGTVAGAAEAALQSIPGIAISAHASPQTNFAGAAGVAAVLARRALETGLPQDVILNVNYPEQWNGEVRWTRQGRNAGRTVLIENLDPRGRQYFWLHEEIHVHEGNHNGDEILTDFAAISSGFVSITPLRLDRTANKFLGSFLDWASGLQFPR